MQDQCAIVHERLGRWTLRYYLLPKPPSGLGRYLGEAEILDGEKVRACFMLSQGGTFEEMQQRLRGYCVEWVLDTEEPGRAERRREAELAALRLRGQVGEKGVR